MRTTPDKIKEIKEKISDHNSCSFQQFSVVSAKRKKPALRKCLKSIANADCPLSSTQSGYALDIT